MIIEMMGVLANASDVSERVESMSARVENRRDKVDASAGRLEAVNDRVDGVEAKMMKLNKDMQAEVAMIETQVEAPKRSGRAILSSTLWGGQPQRDRPRQRGGRLGCGVAAAGAQNGCHRNTERESKGLLSGRAQHHEVHNKHMASAPRGGTSVCAGQADVRPASRPRRSEELRCSTTSRIATA